MDYYLFYYVLVPGASLIGLLAVLFVVMMVISLGKHKRIINEVSSAKLGDTKGNGKLGFYPPEDKGSFGKESFKMKFEDDGEIDMSAFTLTSAEKQQFPREQVVEHQAQDAQVKDFDTVSGSMVGYQHQTSFSAATPLQQQPAAPMQSVYAQPPMQGQPGQVPPGYGQPPMQGPPGQMQPGYVQPPMQQAPMGQIQQPQVFVNLNVPPGQQQSPPQY